MDNKITVCSLTLSLASFVGVAVPGLIALGLLPTRFYGLGHVGLAIAMCLYMRRQIGRCLAKREEIAFKLGQASGDINKGSLAGVRSLVD